MRLPSEVARAREASMHPMVKLFLDGASRLPNGEVDASGALDGAMSEVRTLMGEALALGEGPGGYDRSAAEAIAFAVCSALETLAPGEPVGGERHGRVVKGAMVGLLIATGGQRAYGRYIRRFGAVDRLLRTGMPGVAMGLLAERDHLVDRLATTAPSLCVERSAPRVPSHLLEVAGTGRLVALPCGSVQTNAPVRIGAGDVPPVRTYFLDDALLFHGLDVFGAFGYRNASSSLADFVSRNAEAPASRVLDLEDAQGIRRPTTCLTVSGVVLVVSQMGNRAPGRRDGSRFVAGLLSRLLPSGAFAVDVALHAAARAAAAATDTLRRANGILSSRVARLEGLVRDLHKEVERLRDDADSAGAARRLRVEVSAQGDTIWRLERDLRLATVRVAVVEGELEAERGERLAAEAGSLADKANALHWETVAKDLLRSGARGGAQQGPPDRSVN